MPTIPVTCPACRTGGNVDESWAGRQLQCRKCAAGFTVPAGGGPGIPAAPAAAAAAETVPARCPGCGLEGRIPASRAGTTLQCRQCGKSFVVAVPQAARAAALGPLRPIVDGHLRIPELRPAGAAVELRAAVDQGKI